ADRNDVVALQRLCKLSRGRRGDCRERQDLAQPYGEPRTERPQHGEGSGAPSENTRGSMGPSRAGGLQRLPYERPGPVRLKRGAASGRLGLTLARAAIRRLLLRANWRRGRVRNEQADFGASFKLELHEGPVGWTLSGDHRGERMSAEVEERNGL